MKLNSSGEMGKGSVNVVCLFGREEILLQDPLTDLIKEAEVGGELLSREEVRTARMVSEAEFPDQSMFILDEQLVHLRASLSRIKFYLGEVEDILPAAKNR